MVSDFTRYYLDITWNLPGIYPDSIRCLRNPFSGHKREGVYCPIKPLVYTDFIILFF